jgi:hypothetical protein
MSSDRQPILLIEMSVQRPVGLGSLPADCPNSFIGSCGFRQEKKRSCIKSKFVIAIPNSIKICLTLAKMKGEEGTNVNTIAVY